MKVRHYELRFHMRYLCTHRLVQCRFEFCDATFIHEDREKHERVDCRYIYSRNMILSEVGR